MAGDELTGLTNPEGVVYSEKGVAGSFRGWALVDLWRLQPYPERGSLWSVYNVFLFFSRRGDIEIYNFFPLVSLPPGEKGVLCKGGGEKLDF